MAKTLASKLQSMTGFASQQTVVEDRTILWEIRSVNGKGLDLRFRLPSGLERLEVALRKYASEKLSRGNIQLSLNIVSDQQRMLPVVNEPYLAMLVALSKKMEQDYQLPPARIDGLLAIKGVLDDRQSEQGDGVSPALEAAIVTSFQQAVDALVDMRQQEGIKLVEVLSGHIDGIEQLTEAARQDSARDIKTIRERLKTQIALLVEETKLDENRLYTEAAYLATKSDIQEELDRLDAHIAAARSLLQGKVAAGRKLDFLAQEFNREVNTLCSKANASSLSVIGLAMKAVVDQFREQIQNLE